MHKDLLKILAFNFLMVIEKWNQTEKQLIESEDRQTNCSGAAQPLIVLELEGRVFPEGLSGDSGQLTIQK